MRYIHLPGHSSALQPLNQPNALPLDRLLRELQPSLIDCADSISGDTPPQGKRALQRRNDGLDGFAELQMLLIPALQGHLLLGITRGEKHGLILHRRGCERRIMAGPEEFQQLSISDHPGIEIDLDALGMIPQVVICGVCLGSTRIPDTRAHYTRDAPKLGVWTPKSTQGECRRFDFQPTPESIQSTPETPPRPLLPPSHHPSRGLFAPWKLHKRSSPTMPPTPNLYSQSTSRPSSRTSNGPIQYSF